LYASELTFWRRENFHSWSYVRKSGGDGLGGQGDVMIRCRYDAKTSTINFIKKNDDKIRKTKFILVNTDRGGFIVINH